MKNLLIVKSQDLGTAILIANELSTEEGKILELSPLGEGGHLFIDVNNCNYLKTVNKYEKNIQYTFFENLSDEVWNAYLSLTNSKVSSSLSIFEDSFIGNLFKIADAAVKDGLKIVDLRLLRSTKAYCYLFLTSNEKEKIAQFQIKSSSFSAKNSYIENVSNDLKNYF